MGGQPHVEPDLRKMAPKVRARQLSLSDEELRLAYAGAAALVYPSRYEGFGLPVAEAMACGCPVITTKLASLPEVAGDAALYVDPDDPKSLREALNAVRDPERRATLVAAGTVQASAFRGTAHPPPSRPCSRRRRPPTPPSSARGADGVKARRTAQASRERQRRGNRLPEPIQRRRATRHALLELRLKSAAVRYLPPRVFILLRSAKRALG